MQFKMLLLRTEQWEITTKYRRFCTLRLKCYIAYPIETNVERKEKLAFVAAGVKTLFRWGSCALILMGILYKIQAYYRRQNQFDLN